MSLNGLKAHLATLPKVESTNQLSKQFNVDPTTVNRTMRRLGYVYTDKVWYSPKQRQPDTYTLTISRQTMRDYYSVASDDDRKLDPSDLLARAGYYLTLAAAQTPDTLNYNL